MFQRTNIPQCQSAIYRLFTGGKVWPYQCCWWLTAGLWLMTGNILDAHSTRYWQSGNILLWTFGQFPLSLTFSCKCWNFMFIYAFICYFCWWSWSSCDHFTGHLHSGWKDCCHLSCLGIMLTKCWWKVCGLAVFLSQYPKHVNIIHYQLF